MAFALWAATSTGADQVSVVVVTVVVVVMVVVIVMTMVVVVVMVMVMVVLMATFSTSMLIIAMRNENNLTHLIGITQKCGKPPVRRPNASTRHRTLVCQNSRPRQPRVVAGSVVYPGVSGLSCIHAYPGVSGF